MPFHHGTQYRPCWWIAGKGRDGKMVQVCCKFPHPATRHLLYKVGVTPCHGEHGCFAREGYFAGRIVYSDGCHGEREGKGSNESELALPFSRET
jgi:hypothetical protein